jgi:hypothetical protein
MRLDHPMLLVLLMLLVLTRDLREAFEDPMLGVADARNAGAVGEAQLRHLAAGLGTRRWRIFSGIFLGTNTVLQHKTSKFRFILNLNCRRLLIMCSIFL